VLEDISHPNIVYIFEILEDKDRYFIISELIKHGELYDYAKKRNKTGDRFDENEIKIISEEILLALNHIHHKNLLHRDLKPQNILMLDLETLEIKIADFGFATFFKDGEK
jgi:serine/threonine protein kinase